ncbi:hypothetical protein A5791_13145 [Mycobacterium sp. 852002-51163_SCH5372311]|uniref:hypothetical protein n=1 Tax=Mycobacterium sp. 852002-51163_SCH5372311 TaxID=1834097 RepID=UPI0007FD50F6|nr:hypothetical protein [Mycobacterium sp. 852002-51163_SCH5372311]OBF92817.1 hypothetical protein A5791_13145 [Mycobacterium sp. 852002-51163_SCH5372311]
MTVATPPLIEVGSAQLAKCRLPAPEAAEAVAAAKEPAAKNPTTERSTAAAQPRQRPSRCRSAEPWQQSSFPRHRGR